MNAEETGNHPANILENIEQKLASLGCELVRLDIVVRGKVTDAIVLARRDDGTFVTWASAQTDHFGGLFWGHYDLDGVEAVVDFEQRRCKLPGSAE